MDQSHRALYSILVSLSGPFYVHFNHDTLNFYPKVKYLRKKNDIINIKPDLTNDRKFIFELSYI